MIRIHSRTRAPHWQVGGIANAVRDSIAYSYQLALEARLHGSAVAEVGWLKRVMEQWQLAETLFPGRGEQIYQDGCKLGKDRFDVCYVVYGKK